MAMASAGLAVAPVAGRAKALALPSCSSSLVHCPLRRGTFLSSAHKWNGGRKFAHKLKPNNSGSLRRSVVMAASRRSGEEEEEEEEQEEELEVRDEWEGGSDEVIDVSNELEEGGGRSGQTAEESYKEEYKRFREALDLKRDKFWHNFKEQHAVYKMDRDQWGVGLSPIFTVYEDAEGKPYKVEVDENEVYMRCGVDSSMPQLVDDDGKELAKERLARARVIAAEIERGVYTPSPLSVLYKYERQGQASTIGRPRNDGRDYESDVLSSPWQYLSFIPLFLPVVLLGFGIKWVLGRMKPKQDPVVDEKELRLMQMRKIKAQMNRKAEGMREGGQESSESETGDKADPPRPDAPEVPAKDAVVDVIPNGAVHLKLEDGEFQKKVVEIRAMARRARLQEQQNAEARAAQSLEKSERIHYKEDGTRVKDRLVELEKLAKRLDDVRHLGETSSDEETGPTPDISNFVNGIEPGSSALMKSDNGKPSGPPNGKPSTLARSISPPSNESNTGDVAPEHRLPPKLESSNSTQPPAGVKPRIILSAKEARASIAAKRARLDACAPSTKTGIGRINLDSIKSKVESRKVKSAGEASKLASANGTGAQKYAEMTPKESGADGDTPSADFQPPASSSVGQEDTDSDPVLQEKASRYEQNEGKSAMSSHLRIEEMLKKAMDGVETSVNDGKEGSKPNTSKEEEEEQNWMRDEVLRDIVFKVQANEEAGREPFHSLNSEQETLFFKGLERKFEREGDRVKTWIKERVENIDYGADGVSVHDPPESYTLKWKDGMEQPPSRSDFFRKFTEDRQQIMNKQSGMNYTSSPYADDEPEPSSSPSPPEPSPPTPPSPTSSLPEIPPESDKKSSGQVKSREYLSSSRKTVISSTAKSRGFAPPGTSKENRVNDSTKDWQHTKRWAKDLERKYELEKDPATKAIMREMGQDLDRWITEEEIEQANTLLEKGVEGEEEYVRMHYEKAKAKLKQQRQDYGRDAMLNKYSEYKPEEEETELWWLELPWVLCIGLQATVNGEVQAGLYSVDLGAVLGEGAQSPSGKFYTVAFQDRGDAQNFCRIISSQPEKLGADGAEVIPFSPKDLYKDAKAEGFKVTVVKRGQLQLSVDQTLDEVEARILEIGSARYYDDLLRNRSIDMDAVLDEGLGYGQYPQL